MSIFDDISPRQLGDAALDRLRRLVELESPSDHEAGLRAVAADFAAELTAAGADVDTVDIEGLGEHVIGRLAGREPRLEPVLILGHLDTVHPVGTFDPPFRVADGRAYGPGTFDMKGGLACMLEALTRLRDAGTAPRRPVIVLATCDEETRSATARPLIEEFGTEACAVLVPEPPLPGGRAKTRRKGAASYRIDVGGKAAHAGLAPQDGVNAIVELAHQVLAATALSDPGAGTTLSIGIVGGGTATNVVPAEAWALVDVRFTREAEARRVDGALRALEPILPGASVMVTGEINCPPMERTDGIAALYEHARTLAAKDGWELGEGLSGGASDGSLTAALGTPTLDGIGPDGAGAHAADEHIQVDDLHRRVRLYGRLLDSL